MERNNQPNGSYRSPNHAVPHVFVSGYMVVIQADSSVPRNYLMEIPSFSMVQPAPINRPTHTACLGRLSPHRFP